MAADPPIPPDAGTPEDAPPSPQPRDWVPPVDIPRADPASDLIRHNMTKDFPSSQELLKQMLARRGGNTQLAFADASDMRDPRTGGDPQNPNLRNAEHALFVQQVLDQLHLPPAAAALTPAYSAAKLVGQPLGAFKGASQPSWDEVKYGLWPLLRQLGLMK